MSQRQLALRAAAMLSATAAALAPVADLVAKRRRKRHDNDDEDDGDGSLAEKLARRRRRRDNDDDEDDDGGRLRGNQRSKRSDERDDDARDDTSRVRAEKRDKRSDDTDDADDAGNAGRDSAASGQQSIVGDLDLQGIIDDRLSKALNGGGGGGSDEPNITVSEDGDNLVVLTDDIEFAGDDLGFEVETDGISYSSGSSSAGGDTDQDFNS